MFDGLLAFDDGEVRLGGKIVPGILVSQQVRGGVRFDAAEKDSLSGKAKIPLGWEDTTIALVIDLLSDDEGDCYAKLTALNRIFRATQKADPKIYPVTNRHTRARGIDRVVFAGLDSEEDDQSDVIRATLNFVEHLPAIVRQETQVAAAGTASTAPAVTAQPAAPAAIIEDDDSPFAAGFKQGAS